MMKILIVLGLFSILINRTFAQARIQQNDIAKYSGKTVEILGRSYFIKSINRDFATIKLGYNLTSAKLLAYLKFRDASAFANMTNREFGHFVGTVVIIKGIPVLVVDKLSHASFYVPYDERVDSALYYHKRNKL